MPHVNSKCCDTTVYIKLDDYSTLLICCSVPSRVEARLRHHQAYCQRQQVLLPEEPLKTCINRLTFLQKLMLLVIMLERYNSYTLLLRLLLFHTGNQDQNINSSNFIRYIKMLYVVKWCQPYLRYQAFTAVWEEK